MLKSFLLAASQIPLRNTLFALLFLAAPQSFNLTYIDTHVILVIFKIFPKSILCYRNIKAIQSISQRSRQKAHRTRCLHGPWYLPCQPSGALRRFYCWSTSTTLVTWTLFLISIILEASSEFGIRFHQSECLDHTGIHPGVFCLGQGWDIINKISRKEEGGSFI